MRRDALRRRVIVAVGGDATQSYIAVLTNFGMTSHRVGGPCDDLRHIVN